MATLQELEVKVTNIETVSDSIIALCQGISELLKQCQQDPTKIQELADRLQAKADAIAAAVVANTPVA